MRQLRPKAGRHAAGPLPSATAQRRLATAIEREVGDLRVRVHEGLLRSELLLEMGRPEAAAKVLDESRVLIDLLHERLTSALAAAAVEREAEAVLAEADERLSLTPQPRAEHVPTARGRLTGLLAAVASAVAGLLLVVGPTTSQDPPALSVDQDGEPARTVTPADDERAATPVEAKPDSTLAAAALAALADLDDGQAASDRAATAGAASEARDGGDEGDDEGDEEDGWIERLLLSHFEDGLTSEPLSDVGLQTPDELPDGGPPVTETIEGNPAPIDEDGDQPHAPIPDGEAPDGAGA